MLGFLNQISKGFKKRQKRLTRKEQNELMVFIAQSDGFDEYNEHFNLLYESLEKELWYGLWNKFKNQISKEDLEDVFQEAWIKLLQARTKYNNESDVYNWVYRITYNLIIDKIRKYKNSNTDSLTDFNDELLDVLIPNGEPSIENKMIINESAALIRQAIDNIDDYEEKEIIKRRIILENSFEQISQDLNLPLTTVYRKTKKCLELLRKKLEKVV